MIPSKWTQLIRSDSTATSGWWFTGDFQTVMVSWTSTASLGPSRFTVQTTQEDGFLTGLTAATSNASVSVMTGVNMIGVTPGIASLTSDGGFRWMRVTVAPANHSTVSASIVQLTGTSWS